MIAKKSVSRKCAVDFSSHFLMYFKKINVINIIQGIPWKKRSNMSLIPMPLPPPSIHLTLPTIWGSGKKGAKPNVKEAISAIQIHCASILL